jgi:hypothetical protein
MSFEIKYLKYKNKYLNLKQQYGGNPEPITIDDILYKDEDVCILKPEVKKGILIFSNYRGNNSTICTTGLKTGAQLHLEGVSFGRNVYHPYIFFRAPYLKNKIDYTTIDTEIESSFGIKNSDIPSRVWIRIDPDNTNVYSSEIRAAYNPRLYYNSLEYLKDKEKEINKSCKLMTDYLEIINDNSQIEVRNGYKILYNLYSSKATQLPYNTNLEYPYNSNDINKNSEVLVRIPHLTPNYFVKCTESKQYSEYEASASIQEYGVPEISGTPQQDVDTQITQSDDVYSKYMAELRKKYGVPEITGIPQQDVDTQITQSDDVYSKYIAELKRKYLN